MSDDEPIIVRTLIVDDQDDDRNSLRQAFETASGDGYRFEVEEAESVSAYHERIKESSFDVLAVDVRLGAKPDDIVEFQQVYAPATITIVCSSFAGLDPLPTCVRAIRAGAVDCISKHDSNWQRSVLDSVLGELQRRNSPDHGPTPAWLEQNLRRLSQQFPGQAVAMIGQDVVASAPSVADLRQMLPRLNLATPPFFMVLPPGA